MVRNVWVVLNSSYNSGRIYREKDSLFVDPRLSVFIPIRVSPDL